MTDEEKMIKALETLAYGGIESKTVTQYKRGQNGRDVVVGKVVTETNKLPDRNSLTKLMEIKGVYVDANIKLKQQKVDEVLDEKELVDFIEDIALN